MATPSDSGPIEALVVDLGEVRFALPSTAVVEVARAVATTPLPGAPPVIEGAIGFRGSTVPVLDLRRRLELPGRPVAAADHLVVIRAGRRVVGLVVDRALGLRTIDRATLAPARALGRGMPLLSGAWQDPDGVIVILDPERFLDEAEERSLAQALAARGPP